MGKKNSFCDFFAEPIFALGVGPNFNFLTVFFCVLGVILLLLQETVRTLDSGIAVHSYTGIQMSISWTLGLQSIAFSESKARCRTGHETRKRGTTSSGANSPMILAFLQKGGQGQKLFYFCDFFCGTHFCVRREANNQLFFCVFFCGQQHLVPGIKYFRKSLEFSRYVTPAFSGVPNKGEQNQKSKPTLGVTMMPLVSQSMGTARHPNSCTALSAPP